MAIVFNKAKANYVVPEEPRGSRSGGKSRNAMNRVPSVGRLESKDGANLDYFDDGKGSVSSTSYGGYKTAISSRVEDMDRVEDAINPRSMTSQKANSATFRGMVHMGGIGFRAVKIGTAAQPSAKYVSSEVLYLDGTLGGEIATFIRTDDDLLISRIVVDQTGQFLSSMVILESGDGDWTLDCAGSGSINDDINMDSDDILYKNLDGSNQFTIPSGGRVFLTQSSHDWKVQSVSSYGGLDVQFSGGSITLTNSSSPSVVADEVSLASSDASSGGAILNISQENAPASSTTWAMSHRVKVKINGTEYYLALDAV